MHANENYLYRRMAELANSYTLRVLLVLIDDVDSERAMREIANLCTANAWTLMVAWDKEEAARILELYKTLEFRKATDILGRKADKEDLEEVLKEVLNSVKGVNKTNVETLRRNFGSFKGVVQASKEDLSKCAGIADKKADLIFQAMNEPFFSSG